MWPIFEPKSGSVAMPGLRLDLLRHGATVEQNRFCGSSESTLTDAGRASMWAAIDAVGPWDSVVSSPSQRCLSFAQALADRLGIALHVDPRFRELHFGAWEGLTSADIYAHSPQSLLQFWNEPTRYAPPGGEPLIAFCARVDAAVHALLAQGSQSRVLIVTHGGPMRYLLCRARGQDVQTLLSVNVEHASLHSLYASMDATGPLLRETHETDA